VVCPLGPACRWDTHAAATADRPLPALPCHLCYPCPLAETNAAANKALYATIPLVNATGNSTAGANATLAANATGTSGSSPTQLDLPLLVDNNASSCVALVGSRSSSEIGG